MYKHVVQMYLDSTQSYFPLWVFPILSAFNCRCVIFIYIPKQQVKNERVFPKSIRKSQRTANWFKEDFLLSSCARFHKN